ncbi:MAG: GNAT family N-acetyltransferase [Actinomycetes bacterium]
MILIRPTMAELPSFLAAIERLRELEDPKFAWEVKRLAAIQADPEKFVADRIDLEGKRPDIELDDGTFVPPLPAIEHWMWDGEVCGAINVRWIPGTTELPPFCMGHIGYGVFPWKQRQGYGTRALALMLPVAREVGLPYVDLVIDTDNQPSQHVARANGAVLIETFEKPAPSGGEDAYRFRIYL